MITSRSSSVLMSGVSLSRFDGGNASQIAGNTIDQRCDVKLTKQQQISVNRQQQQQQKQQTSYRYASNPSTQPIDTTFCCARATNPKTRHVPTPTPTTTLHHHHHCCCCCRVPSNQIWRVATMADEPCRRCNAHTRIHHRPTQQSFYNNRKTTITPRAHNTNLDHRQQHIECLTNPIGFGHRLPLLFANNILQPIGDAAARCQLCVEHGKERRACFDRARSQTDEKTRL
jgi:hypothetical protein